MWRDIPGVSIIPFHWGHPYAANLREFDQAYFRDVPNYRDVLRMYQATGNAYTAMVGGKVACCFGYQTLWPGVAEAWMLTSDQVNTKAVSLTRSAGRYFDHIATKEALRRLQITVNARHRLAVRWADALQFTREGVLRHYGPDKSDHIMFARYYDGRNNETAARHT
jgi:hypothetical protein